MVQLGHKIKLYPNKEALEYLKRASGTARFAYNWALARWQALYAEGVKGMSAYSLRNEFNSIRREEFPWTYEVSKWASQKGIENLGEAFQRFFKKTSRYPKFKKKGQSKTSFYLGVSDVHVKGKYLKLPNFKGAIKMAQKIRFEGAIKSVTISMDSSGDWWAAFSVLLDESYVYPHKCENQAFVGIDLGIKTLAKLSDGSEFKNPKALRVHERKLKRTQRRFSKKVKGSSNRIKARLTLARVHRKVARIRNDTLHKMTTNIVRRYRVIGIEDLHVKGMLKNHKLAKSLSDVALGEIRRQLEYKSKLSGSFLEVINRFYPSSKTCFDCGFKLKDLDLLVRDWVCPNCKAEHDRDLNAAKNIEHVARSQWETLNVCGEDVRPKTRKRNRQPLLKQKLKTTCKPKNLHVG